MRLSRGAASAMRTCCADRWTVVRRATRPQVGRAAAQLRRCSAASGTADHNDGAEHQSVGFTHGGQCHCGTCRYEVSGKPSWVAHCHALRHRQSHGALYVTLVAYEPSHFVMLQGEGYLHRKMYGSEYKHTCKRCASHVYEDWLPLRKKVVYLTQLDLFGGAHSLTGDWRTFEPQFHIHYDSAVLPVADGLPKFAQLPSEWRSGTGRMVDDWHPERRRQEYSGASSAASHPEATVYNLPMQPPRGGSFGSALGKLPHFGMKLPRNMSPNREQPYNKRIDIVEGSKTTPVPLRIPVGRSPASLYPDEPSQGA